MSSPINSWFTCPRTFTGSGSTEAGWSHIASISIRWPCVDVPKWIDIPTTIDGDYLMGLGADASQLYVARTSDDFFCVDAVAARQGHHDDIWPMKTRDLIRFSLVG